MKLPEFTMAKLRNIALAMIGVLNVIATVVAFEESYAGLYQWAHQHNVLGFNAGIWPLMVDLIILVAEAALFVAHHDKWKWRHKVWLWFVMFTALGVSTGGNTGHVHSTDWLSHLTAALPPVALMFTMTVGFGVMKRTFMNKPAPAILATPSQPRSEEVFREFTRGPERVHAGTEPWVESPALAASHAPAESPATPVGERPAPEVPEPFSGEARADETRAQTGFKVTPKSYSQPADARPGLELVEKRVRDMYDVDPDISVNAIAKSLGIAWATADKYLKATKKARGIAE